MLKLIRFAKSTLVETPNFPIKFGRRLPANTVNNDVAVRYVTDLFGDSTGGYITAYNNIIDAFQERDKDYLGKNLELNLLKDTIIPDLEVANEQSPVYVKTIECSHIFGVPFERRLKPKDLVKQSIPSPVALT